MKAMLMTKDSMQEYLTPASSITLQMACFTDEMILVRFHGLQTLPLLWRGLKAHLRQAISWAYSAHHAPAAQLSGTWGR